MKFAPRNFLPPSPSSLRLPKALTLFIAKLPRITLLSPFPTTLPKSLHLSSLPATYEKTPGDTGQTPKWNFFNSVSSVAQWRSFFPFDGDSEQSRLLRSLARNLLEHLKLLPQRFRHFHH